MGKEVLTEDYEKMIEGLPRLVMLIDLKGTILFWNKGGTQLFGYTSEEITGKPVWSLYPERSKKDFTKELERLEKREEIIFEAKGKRKDDSTIWVDVRRKIILNNEGEEIILGTASDISSQKKAEQELEEQKAKLHAILETTVDGIITIDKNGIIQTFNRAAETIFGYDSEEVIGENVSMLMPEPYRREHDRYIDNYLETGQKKIIGIGREVRGKRKDGTVFPMELAVSEVRLDDEIVFSGIVRDISQRRKLENEVLQISEGERRRIGQDLHDGLGQMLTGIGLISQNLARKLKSNELPGANEVQEIADMIKEADQQAKGLAHGLVNIDLESEGLRVALENLCQRSERLFKIRCTFHGEGELADHKGNAAYHLYRITQEAISNAVKHGKANHIKVQCSCGDHYIRLMVEDDGVGFSKSLAESKAKGMGLNTMHYRAHIMGGHLEITDSDEGNTQIICRIPTIEVKENNTDRE